MTPNPVQIETVRSDLRRRAVISAAAGLLGASALLTWVVAGTWVTLGLLALLVGVALALSARHASRLEEADRADGRVRSGPGPESWREVVGPNRAVVVAALRHDLPLMVATCQTLPSGGLPRAALLAEHTYVATEALQQLLARDGSRCPSALALERGAVAAQLAEVTGRTGRLYSADRPGGLDHLDWHLARLWVLTEEYLAEGPAERVTGPVRSAAPGGGRSPVLSPRARARVLAWTAVASGADVAVLRRGQALRTRMWLRLGAARRARGRAVRLWGHTLPVPAAVRQAVASAPTPARTGRGAA